MEARADPLVIGAVGGSGTRVFTRIARHAGMFMGGVVDDQEDSRPLSPLYGEYASEYLERWNDLEPARQAQMAEVLRACVGEHLDGLPAADHPWGVKNPRSMLMLPLWHASYPEMRFLHVIRSGLDMAYSPNENQIRRHGRTLLGPDSERPKPERAILWWAASNSLVADYGEAELRDRYLRVRLEDLCAQPKRTLRQLFEFIDAGEGRPKRARREIETPSSLGRWRTQPDPEVDRLIVLGRGALERFGYLPEGRDPGAGSGEGEARGR